MTRAIHDSFIMLPLTVLAVVGAAFARADEILSEDVGTLTWKYTITNGAARVYGGHMQTAIGWTSGAVVIPDTLAGLPVKAIGSYAFFQLGQMTSLEIPDSVESIEFYACRGCTNLVTATLPPNLTTMGNGVFAGCQKLEVGCIPDSVTSMGRDTFWGCKSMGSVKFSSQVRDLGAMTCFDCDSLTEVSIPDCVTNIGVSAFLHCDNLRLVTLPKGEVTFGNYAFNSCPSLEVVDVSSGFIDFDNAFHNCPSLTTARIRQDILYVDPASFVGCSTLTAISVEDGNSAYKSIGGVLYDATGRELVAWPAALQPVVIPVEVERIGDYAFGWTYDKSAIPIPEGVEVSDCAFADPPQEEPEEPEGPVDPPVPEQPREGVFIYRDCFKIVPGQIPHLSCVVPRLEGIDYAVDRYESNNWEVVIHGWGMADSRIKVAKPGEHYVDDSDMPASVYRVTGTSQPFVFEFCNWYRNKVLDSKTWYGYASIALDHNGQLVILESAICNEQGVLFADGGPGVPGEGLIWRCNFNNGVLWQPLTNYHGAAGHVLLSGDDVYAELDDGSSSGRRSVEVYTHQGERAWFTVNETTNAVAAAHHAPAKWQSLATYFKMYSFRGDDGDDLYPSELPSNPEGSPPPRRAYIVPGSRVNIDDKVALWFSDDGRYSCWWVNAGVPDGVGGLVARTMPLMAKDREHELSSPVRNWVSIEIEAVNDGSPLGLAYRVYIDGVLACAAVNTTPTVFRARPMASDRIGVTALGIGGEAFIDDVVFRSASIEPLAGVDITPSRFGPANEGLTAGELDALATIVGLESLSGLERITMHPWEDDSGCEPLDAPKTCIDLGISPFHVKPDSYDGKGLTLFFKNPTAVKAIGIDPAARTVTGQIVPAEGTRVVQPPQRFMFGLKHYLDFGTPYAHAEEYGYDMYFSPDGDFQLDTARYASSNGLFTITYAPKFAEDDSAFFLLSIKDFRN